jgi:kynurenine formamidase
MKAIRIHEFGGAEKLRLEEIKKLQPKPDAAQWLVEKQQAMLLGADNFGIERFPSNNPDNFLPVHTYLLAERGVSMIEVMWLEELAKDQVYEFVFIAAPLKLRGATGSPLRPLAIPLSR